MSQRKNGVTWVLVLGVLILVAGAALYILWPQLQPHTTVRVGDGVFTTKVAKTSAEREKGLGGTHSLGAEQAMLLVYDTDNEWKVGMKDMQYPLDIVWLDKEKKVVYIVKNAPPESYPYEEFTSKNKARYVLLIEAGNVARKKINVGSEAAFDENNLEGIKL